MQPDAKRLTPLSCALQSKQFNAVLQAAMQYTESQIQDLLHLRRLFIQRIGQLARERKSLLDNMAQCKTNMGHVCDKVCEVSKWSELLRENGDEEHRSYMQIITASCRGVSLLFKRMPVGKWTIRILPAPCACHATSPQCMLITMLGSCDTSAAVCHEHVSTEQQVCLLHC